MKSLKLNEAGDLVIDGQGGLVMVDGADELAQALRLRLATAAGEWFLDLDFGVPWMDGILGTRPPNEDLIRAEVLRAIGQEPRVTAVESLALEFDPGGRVLTIRFTVRGAEDQIIAEEVTVG